VWIDEVIQTSPGIDTSGYQIQVMQMGIWVYFTGTYTIPSPIEDLGLRYGCMTDYVPYLHGRRRPYYGLNLAVM